MRAAASTCLAPRCYWSVPPRLSRTSHLELATAQHQQRALAGHSSGLHGQRLHRHHLGVSSATELLPALDSVKETLGVRLVLETDEAPAVAEVV